MLVVANVIRGSGIRHAVHCAEGGVEWLRGRMPTS